MKPLQTIQECNGRKKESVEAHPLEEGVSDNNNTGQMNAGQASVS